MIFLKGAWKIKRKKSIQNYRKRTDLEPIQRNSTQKLIQKTSEWTSKLKRFIIKKMKIILFCCNRLYTNRSNSSKDQNLRTLFSLCPILNTFFTVLQLLIFRTNKFPFINQSMNIRWVLTWPFISFYYFNRFFEK